MRRLLRWTGILLATIAALLIVAAAAVFAVSSWRLSRSHDVPDEAPVPLSQDPGVVERGRYLATSVSSCILCHGADFGGSVYEDAGPMGLIAGPNLTRGPGGIGSAYTDRDWERAVRHGVRPDGSSLLVMPSEVYVYLTDDDFAAIVAYIRQVQPISRQPPATVLRPLGRALLTFGQLPILVAEKTPAIQHERSLTPGVTADYGNYLASISGCHGCHGAGLSGGTVAGPPGTPLASNLTPAGLGQWSKQDFVRAMRIGTRPDNRPIDQFMPWVIFANMTDADLEALWVYLKSVPAKSFGNK